MEPATSGADSAPPVHKNGGPAQKVSKKYPLPPVRWPTAEEARASLWFSPIHIGKLWVEARTWGPAMVPWRAAQDGFVTPPGPGWDEGLPPPQPRGLGG